jgi:hypothetical protein
MARFPKSEAEAAALARRMITGLTEGTEEFPAPPVPPQEIEAALAEYDAAKDAALAADGAAREKYAVKDEAFEKLVDLMKADLRYAENTVRHEPEKLKQLGWGGRKSGTIMEVPGQVRSLELVGQGEGWCILDWKAPSSGGSVAAYRVQYRTKDTRSWSDAGMSIESEVVLSGQQRGVELLYQVVAVNKSGEGEPSNVVSLVL